MTEGFISSVTTKILENVAMKLNFTDDIEFYADKALFGKMTGMSWFTAGPARNAVNGASMTVYMILLMVLAVAGEMLADLVRALIDMLMKGGA